MCACQLSHFSVATLGTVAHQAPLSMGFLQARMLECHALLQGIFPTQGSNPSFLSPAFAGSSLPLAPPGKPAATAAKLLQLCLTLCNPIDRQLTRLPCPWDSPGKNTGVGCHFLLQRMKARPGLFKKQQGGKCGWSRVKKPQF